MTVSLASRWQQRRRWPTSARVTLVVLIVLLFVAAGLRQPADKTVVVADLPAPTVPTTVPPATLPPTTESPTTSTSTTTTTLPATTSPPTAPPPTAARTSGIAALDALPVVALDTSRHYDREADFGSAWTDNVNVADGHNGCDTRNDILKRDLTQITTQPGDTCTVTSGVLHDPYSGQRIDFRRGQGTSSKVQIDHLVPLHAAWQLGAWQWPQAKRVDYANDPNVLLAVSGTLNASKSDRLADEWLPPNAGYRCAYASMTVVVHVKYSLPVTAGEKATLVSILAHC